MIRVGLSKRSKQKVVSEYLERHPDIKKVYCFYFKYFKPLYKVDCDIEYIEYSDIIMYKFFYRLLEEIDKTSLIIMDGCMRTRNRSDLTYNCAHHYLNQTPHRIVFEYFPFIEDKSDFMILLDMENKDKYKGKGFDWQFLIDEDIKMQNRSVKLQSINVETTQKDIERYEKKKNSLFDNLGNKDPNTIPRALQLLAGDIKKKFVEQDKIYVARNKRFKMDNVASYGNVEKKDYIVIDMHYKRLGMCDYFKVTEQKKIMYLRTSLKIDDFCVNDFVKWRARLEAMYAKASVYR